MPKLPSILIGAAVYVLLGLTASVLNAMGPPISFIAGLLSCVAILVGAMVGVWHFTNTHQLTISAGQGAGLGVSVGLVGALISGVLGLALIAAGVLPDPVEAAIEQARAMGQTEEQIDMARSMTEIFAGPVGIAFGLVIGALFGAAGGAIGAAIFKKGEPDRV
ncbi:MAG: DUF4199 family protein [Bacteroidota bacterium]